MFEKYIAWIIFFRVVFLSIIFTISRKSAIGFTPGVSQGVYFEVFISFVHSFGIIVKEKCSPFNQGILHQPIMSINKIITPMTELSDPPSYMIVNLHGINWDSVCFSNEPHVKRTGLRGF